MLLAGAFALVGVWGCEDPAGGFMTGELTRSNCTTDGLSSYTVTASFSLTNIAGDRVEDARMIVSFLHEPMDGGRTGALLCTDTLEIPHLDPGGVALHDFSCAGMADRCPTSYSFTFEGVSSAGGAGPLTP